MNDTDYDDTFAALGGGSTTTRTPELGTVYHDASHLPAGSTARDTNGATIVCWPDGTVGYPGGPRLNRSRAGVSFAPYTLTRIGLTADECDAQARV